MFHVKHFGAINAPRKCTFAKRHDVRNGDFGQAQFWDRFKLWLRDFLKLSRAWIMPNAWCVGCGGRTLPLNYARCKWLISLRLLRGAKFLIFARWCELRPPSTSQRAGLSGLHRHEIGYSTFRPLA
jgi:hypothetical protein